MLTIRNQQVLLDRDVAALYGVETKALNQAVKRNADRFGEGYIFQLNTQEIANWKSQIVTSNLSKEEIAGLKMGLRRAPYAFTERGLYMLATVLNSDRAVRATKAIIETYAKVRSMVCDMEALKTRLNAGRTPDLYFIRDQHGTEIDLVIEDGRSLHLFEIKSSTSFSTDFTRNLDVVRRAIPEVASATVVYGGDSAAAVRDIEFVPFRDLATRMRQLGLA